MEKFNMYVITDTHYFASKLGAYGEEYKKFMQFEQKCFAETQAINEAAFRYLGEAKDADTVLIAGDLSFNGEKESHLEFIELLKELKKAGKKIYVITAGHDFNEHPFAFDNTGRLEPEGTKRDELFDLYYEYGFKDAIAVDKRTLSYVAQLSDGLRLLALNNDGDCGKNRTYDARQIEWILHQTAKAREDGQMMIAMNHYPLIAACPFFELLDGDAVMKNSQYITSLLANEGVHLCFTGHMHNQSIKLTLSDEGKKFWDVCTGSLIGCPASMRLVTIEDESSVTIKTLPVPQFDWDMEGLSNDEYFQRQFDMMINAFLDCMQNDPKCFLGKVGIHDKESLEGIVAKLGGKLNTATVGDVCKLCCVKCDDSVSATPFRTLAVTIVRNIFTGDAPFIYGTPEYNAVMGVLKKFRPIIGIVNKNLKIRGKNADIEKMVKLSIGHYGVSDNNASIELL